MTRILVEKKEPFRLDERDMQQEINDVLNIPGVTGVRIFNGYDIDGVTDTEKAKNVVFSEAGQDDVYENKPDTDEAAYIFAITAAIDQYDQREDYANKLLRIMEPHSKPDVRVFKIIALYGDISQADYEKIKGYYINPLETREIPIEGIKQRVFIEPKMVGKLNGFIDSDDEALEAIGKKYAIAMAPDNLRLCKEYFKKENRDPTVTEMKVLDTYWSDHCRHSTFMTVIEKVSIEENKFAKGLKLATELYEQAKSYVYGENPRPLCLMDIATMEMKKLKKSGELDDLEKSDEVNACSIEVTVPVDGKPEDMIVMFKNETHNHPTEMEPFGGASTCLGGAIRDPLSGRSYVYGAIRLTGSGDPREPVEDTTPGKLPQRKITQTAAKGYSSYGNGIGLPLGHLIEAYDPGFKAKRMECGAVIAAAKKADIVRGKPLPGDVVVLVGGKTGRDGCGGATGSSKEHDEGSLEKGGAEVQKGNPVIERNIVRLFRKPNVSGMIKICNDFGAGGVCVAVGELADGLLINLDKVPVKYPGLDGTELAISESQERMAVVIEAKNLEKFLREANKENLEAAKIADITDNGRVVMFWQSEEILNISSEFLNSGGERQKTNLTVSSPDWSEKEEYHDDIKKTWLLNLKDLNVCSKQGLVNRFDSTAGGVTVFMPYGGVYQKTPEQGLAMKLPLREGETDFGTLMTVGYDPASGLRSPFHAALYAVVESVMKIAAMGGDYSKVRLSFQEYFEKLSSEKSWGKPYAALMGAFLAQDKLGIPAIGGKDSMSGSFMDINVPPSLISFAVAVVDTTKLISRAFKGAGHNVYLLKTPVDEGGVPDFEILKRNMSLIHKHAGEGHIKSTSVVGMGGIAATVSEMAFGNGIGFSFNSTFKENLFSPQYASMIIEVEVTLEGKSVIEDTDVSGSSWIPVGITLEEKIIEINSAKITLDEALMAWESTLDSIFPAAVSETMQAQEINRPRVSTPAYTSSHNSKDEKKPEVLIPVFPGSTGEYELERQFKNAGANVNILLFRTSTTEDIEDSYKELSAAISSADILAIPSGMSAGAEPDGSSKLIALVLRHPEVMESVNILVNRRKGLILGVGEGFKALLKTGLIQTESIVEKECGKIVLAKHPINRHDCLIKAVRIEQVKSPWFEDLNGEIEILPVSGQDSAIHMSGQLYSEYMEKGQIATRYLGELYKGESYPCPIESMISKNGMVLGRTGLVENLRKGLYTNVFNAEESKIFKNAVNYIVYGRSL